MRVLVIDDDEVELRAVTGLLQKRGFDVVTALSSEQAYALLDATRIDGALVDLMMPRMNGIELIRGLKQRAPWLRVVLTSSFPLAHGQLARLGLDDVRFVSKPANTDVLVAAFEPPPPPRDRSTGGTPLTPR